MKEQREGNVEPWYLGLSELRLKGFEYAVRGREEERKRERRSLNIDDFLTKVVE